VLDLCTGTGKLAHELLPYVRPGGRVIGVDFSVAMLEQARRLEPQVEFRLGDVSQLADPDESVEAVTIAFGLRNLIDRNGALTEMRRVLRLGGRLVILEFAPPPRAPLTRAYRFYLGRVMPRLIGWHDASQGAAYRYLAESVDAFLTPAQLTNLLEPMGFRVSVELMTFGIVAIHTAIREA
jgi:demethylmenaquinone methyltransferase/2-methoxy-6-polyprenyl-1,4-benzoquinol methylase